MHIFIGCIVYEPKQYQIYWSCSSLPVSFDASGNRTFSQTIVQTESNLTDIAARQIFLNDAPNSDRIQQSPLIASRWPLGNGEYVKAHIVVTYDDVIQWEHFPRYWPFPRGIHQSPVSWYWYQRPVTRSFDVFFDLRLNKRLSKQS